MSVSAWDREIGQLELSVRATGGWRSTTITKNGLNNAEPINRRSR